MSVDWTFRLFRAFALPTLIGRRSACCAALVVATLLPAHEALAVGCAAATTQGTAPADFKTYCWLDFSTYNDTTARSVAGQAITFNLPDGSTLSMTVKTTVNTGAAPALAAVANPSWSGAAFGNSAFFGISGLPVLYTVAGGNYTFAMSGISITPPAGSGGASNYAMIVADGESTNGGESLIFTTNGNPWVQLAQIPNGSVYPTVAGVGTTTVTETGTGGTVGSFVFGSTGNPTSITTTIAAGGLQGIVIGIRFASISLTAQLSNTRVDPSDQFTYAIKTTAGATINSASTSGTALSGFALAGFPSLAASYPVVLNQVMAAGSASTLANYIETLTCTNANTSSTTALPTNVVTTNFTTPSLQYGDQIACVFTNTPNPRVSGALYNDANRNSAFDAFESGTGLTGLFMKLAAFSAGTCASTATVATAVDATTGAYSFPGVPNGNYCLTLTNNATLSNTTPFQPPGWLRTEAPTGIRQVTVATGVQAPAQNFGIYNGTQLSLTVFADTGVTAGTANDGLKNVSESGIPGVTVNAVVSGVVVGSGVTDANGLALVWLPAGTSGIVTVTPAAVNSYVPTGGSAGTSGGTYTRPSVTFTFAVGQAYTGLLFGLVPPNSFSTDGVHAGIAGTTLYYSHTYVAGSAGMLTLSTSAVAAPALAGWSEVTYIDTTCNAQIGTDDVLVTGAIAMTAGQQICLLLREFIPANAPLNAENRVTVNSVFVYSGSAAPANRTILRIDTTTVSATGAIQLSKRVRNVTTAGELGTTSSASPGNLLQYQLLLTNPGATPVGSLVITDSTPAYTLYASAACPGTLPPGVTACSITTQPVAGGQGGLVWTFSGSMAPGASTTVTYNVKVAN